MTSAYRSGAGLSPKKRALMDEALRKEELSELLARGERKAPCPLSFAQQRLWLLDQLEPGSCAYNVPRALRIRGPLDVGGLEQSFRELVRRHEALRTVFVVEEGRPFQVIPPEPAHVFHVEDLSALPAADREPVAERMMAEEGGRPFDLAKGPLQRTTLLRLDKEEHILLLVVHHIVSDGWSVGVMYREIEALYGRISAGQPVPKLPELPWQYADFACWQREVVQGEVFQEQLTYWKKQLDGAPPVLELPADYPRPSIQTHRGARESIILLPELVGALEGLSRSEGATLFMTMLAAFQTLLCRYTGREEIVTGTPIAGRSHPDVEGLIGFFVNTLVMRTDLSGDPTFRELLRRVRNVALEAYDHQDLPFEKLVEELGPDRDPSHNPLFQVMFTFQNFPRQVLQLPGLAVTPVEVELHQARFDLTVTIHKEAQGLRARADYSTDLFAPATIKRMLGHFQTLLEGVAADPDRHISVLPLLGETERQQLLLEWNDTRRQYRTDRCIHEVFEAQAERTPGAVAVVFEDEQLTYRELNARANRLARRLRTLGVGPETLVGLCVERSLEMVVGVLGILKAGGAYVPMDPAYPPERLSFIAEDTGMPVLLTQRALSGALRLERTKVVCIDSGPEWTDDEDYENVSAGAVAENLAYVIFTSGSTGRPKGVLIEHRSIINYVQGIRDSLELDSVESYAMVQPLTVDASVTVLYPPLFAGGCLHVISRERISDPEALADYFTRHPVGCLKIAPSHLTALLTSSRPERILPRRLLVIGGEPSRRDWAEKLQSLAPHCAIFNHYGPTETTVGVTTYRLEAAAGGRPFPMLPIGRPLPNTRAYILDRHMQPVPLGVAGELHFAGDCLARGYLDRPDLTARQFVPDPFSAEPGARLYKTGDLARYLPDGNIEFLGRRDDQVKIRGFRVEPGEIETALSQHPDVREVVIAVRQDKAGHDCLVAYIVPHPDKTVSPGELRHFLRGKLPDYMVPAAFVPLAALPRTPHGKLDRSALPEPEQAESGLESSYVAPRTEEEKILADIWSRILGVSKVGIQDSFFELGGHSLLAVSLFNEVRKAFGKALPLATLFQAPTIERLASALRDAGWTPLWSSLVPMQPRGSQPPFFCVHGNGGNVLFYSDLARHLSPDQPVYGLQAIGLDGKQAPLTRLEDMAAHYIREIRTIQPRGPYFLGGFCMGAYLTLEMACQLREQGEEVALLASINTDGNWRKVTSLRQSVGYHLRNFSPLKPREKFLYIARRARYRIRRVKVAFVELACAIYRALGRPLPPGVRNTHIHEVNNRASRGFVPRRYDGDLTYFQGDGDTHLDPGPFWSEVIAGEIKVHGVPGTHMTVLTEPNVQVLARSLRNCLEEGRRKCETG